MLKTFLTFSLLIAHLTWVVRPLLPHAEYALGKSYIAEVLCINKEKPELECDGKCYLKARIQEQQQPAPQEKGIVPLSPSWESLQTVEQGSLNEHLWDQEPGSFIRPGNQTVTQQWSQEPLSPPPRFL